MAESDQELPERGSAEGELIRGRYAVLLAIGRGGMAVIHRVKDTATGREVALKRLTVPKDDPRYSTSAELFEREFYTLAQLSHPRIVEVYDYGVDEHGPFYTMELLDGGDVREQSPMGWKEACSVAYDVCSALALLHSRRLVHRDVTPRNVRSTRDGNAKLIDFGAMVPMGSGGPPVGTPQFVAPEIVYRANLDARTDLFSLGATLYYALTGRIAYPARDFVEAANAWRDRPIPPSRYVPGIPEALDSLVLALLSADPATRPRTAFEAMQRLSAVADLRRPESSSVSRAYLSTPVMVGRGESMKKIEEEMRRALGGRGRSILIEGPGGVGRSRVLDASALVSKTLGATVLRASGTALSARNFEVAAALARQLLDNARDFTESWARAETARGVLFEEKVGGAASTPSGAQGRLTLRDLGASGGPRFEIQTALSQWLLEASRETPLVIAVDDFHRIDEPSAALLAALASQIDRRKLLVMATSEAGAEPSDRLALDVFATQSTRVALAPLPPAEVERLFESVFGDVPNVGILSHRIQAVALGNPRESMDLAQHLVDEGVVRYEGGNWTVPARLDAVDLPSSAEGAMLARIASLIPLARWLAEAQALATQRAFTRDDYAKLRPVAERKDIDSAILDLVARQLVTSDGDVYALSHRGWNAVLARSLGDAELKERHAALSSLYEGRLPLGVVRHALMAGLETKALDALSPILPGLPEAANLHEGTDLGAADVAATFEQALTAAERIARPAREVNELRRWLSALSVVSEDRYYWRAAPGWLERLKLDSGYTAWEELREVSDPAERLSQAMQRAFGRYAATPEPERVHRPDEAIKGLAHYVGISIAIASSRLELDLIESLQPLLEPFAPLSPLVATLCRNVAATRESACRSRPERARQLWREVYERLGEIEGADQPFLGVFRRAVAYAVGTTEASMGIAPDAQWANRLHDDPTQRVNGLYLRRIVRLQQGDWSGAEELRRQAEVLSLQTRARQMFASLHAVELTACAMARDVTGLRQCGDRMAALAARSPGWIPHRHVAMGHFHLACDDFTSALAEFESALALAAPRPDKPQQLPIVWSMSVAGQVEALTALGRYEEARAAGESALARCRAHDVEFASHAIVRAVAIAEAKLGDFETARARLDAIIEKQLELQITGLHLGASYEARARVALLSGEADAVERYMALTAHEYRYGQGSPLGARYERLVNEASRASVEPLAKLSDFESTELPMSAAQASAFAFVSRLMRGAAGPDEKAERALRVLCDARAATAGHLFLAVDGRLRPAASHGAHALPEGLGEFVQSYLDRETQESGDVTAAVDEDDAETLGQFTDSRGLTYYPLLLTSAPSPEKACVGVAALAVGSHHRMLDQELLVALAVHVLEEA